MTFSGQIDATTPSNPWVSVVLTVLAIVWLAAWDAGRGGATPGKRVCGLRVVTYDGGRVGFRRAVLRRSLMVVTGPLGWLPAAG